MLTNLVFLLAAVAPPEVLSSPMLGAQYESARALAMGGALRAAADGLEAIWLNPAALTLKRQYVLSGQFEYQELTKSYAPSGAVLDSATTEFAAGVAYGYERRDGPSTGGVDAHRLHFAFGYSFGAFSLGVTGKYQAYNRKQAVSDANGGVLRPPTSEQGLTADAGLLWTVAQPLTLAVVGYNLIPRCKHFPSDCQNLDIAPMGMSVAAALHFSSVTLAGDIVFDFLSLGTTQPRYHLGAEYSLIEAFPLRAGVVIDRLTKETFWTSGFGFSSPTFGIDFAYRQGTQVSNNRTFVTSLRVALN